MTSPISPQFDIRACFFERDPRLALGRRTLAECIGTLLLTFVAVGAGEMAARAALPFGAALALGAVATSAALVGLIVALGPVSGGHFNPLITLLQWLSGQRPMGCMLAYLAGQVAGAIVGAMLANALFELSHAAITPMKPLADLALSEVVASGGLMAIVFGCSLGGSTTTGPFAVGAWLTGAIVGTPSTSYANPAITVAALFAGGGMGLPVHLAGYYILAQLAGSLLALGFIRVVYPMRSTKEAADG